MTKIVKWAKENSHINVEVRLAKEKMCGTLLYCLRSSHRSYVVLYVVFYLYYGVYYC